MKVLVLGGTGMIGHKLVQVLAGRCDLAATVRGDGARLPGGARALAGIDATDGAVLDALIRRERPDAVVNAVGVVKQVTGAHAASDTVAVNALLPHRLAEVCADTGARLVHFSTDCVFSGARDGRRGPAGYRESDPADARDLYGLSKLLGEPSAPGALTLRTSIIGPEIRGGHGLVAWFLSRGRETVRGYAGALYTGLPTVVLAERVATLLLEHPTLDGVWQVASPAISKYDLLGLVRDAFDRPTRIEPDTDFFCDRRLDGSRFAAATGFVCPPWETLVARMAEDMRRTGEGLPA